MPGLHSVVPPGHHRRGPSRTRSELAAPFFGPALDDDLGFGVELDGVAALGVEIAEEAFLPAAEGEERHRRGDAHVDADIASLGLVAELAGGRAAARKEAG